MGNIKQIAHSEWLTFELEGAEKLLDPPVIKLRLRPMTGLDGYGAGLQDRQFSRAMTEMIVESIAEWDLTDADKAIPCTPEKKREMWDWLRVVLGSKVKGTAKAKGTEKLLGIAVIEYAADLENFVRP